MLKKLGGGGFSLQIKKFAEIFDGKTQYVRGTLIAVLQEAQVS